MTLVAIGFLACFGLYVLTYVPWGSVKRWLDHE